MESRKRKRSTEAPPAPSNGKKPKTIQNLTLQPKAGWKKIDTKDSPFVDFGQDLEELQPEDYDTYIASLGLPPAPSTTAPTEAKEKVTKQQKPEDPASKPKKKKPKKTKAVQKPTTQPDIQTEEEEQKKETTTASATEEPTNPKNIDTNTEEELDMSAWENLGIHDIIIKGLKAARFTTPSPIQILSIPAGLTSKKDIVGAAETGSGKTLAFGIPILQQLLELQENSPPDFQTKKLPCLIVTPTRELAIQIVTHLKAISQFSNLKIAPVVGGMAIPKQERLLSKKPDIVVGTPGRLWELISSLEPYLSNLTGIQYFVIDEADRMIEKYHFEELTHILHALNREVVNEEKESNGPNVPRQTFVFSATMTISAQGRKIIAKKIRNQKTSKRKHEAKATDTLDKLIDIVEFKRKVEIIDLTSSSQGKASKLQEFVIECQENEKHPGRTLIFTNSVTCVHRLAPILQLAGIQNIWAMHAQMPQRQRLKNLDRFKKFESSVLVATDVLARGIDINAIDHVVHYQTPRTAEIYVHRSGRTARADKAGNSLLLVTPQESSSYKRICQVLQNEGSEIKHFSVDYRYFKPLQDRIKLAIQIDSLRHRKQRDHKEQTWIEKTAAAMEIDIDEDDLPKKNKTNKSTDLPISDKKERKKLADLQAQLDLLLKQQILIEEPKGIAFSHKR